MDFYRRSDLRKPTIPLTKEQSLEALSMIERRKAVEAELHFVKERISNLSLQLLTIDREQDAWLAETAFRFGIKLERLKNAKVELSVPCISLEYGNKS